VLKIALPAHVIGDTLFEKKSLPNLHLAAFNKMPEDAIDSPFGEPESSLIDPLAVVENFCLAAVTVIVGLDLLERAVPVVAQVLGSGARPMAWGETLAVLLFTISLQCTQPRSPRAIRLAGMAISILPVVWSAVELVKAAVAGGTILVHGSATAMITPQAAVCFALLGTGAVLTRLNGRFAGMTADFLTFCMAFVVAVLATGHLMGSLPFYGPAGVFVTSGETLLCASFFALVIFIRRATHGGVFAILMGSGIGSKIARVLAPFVALLPYFREAVRAHLFSLRRMPSHYTTSIMATMIMFMTIFALMYVAWRMNTMEAEIQRLSLRDPLTGLNNLRGFRLLADQALLMAYRSDLPFSVLYLDVDNLKQINDAMGHQAGSEFLAEMANILREVFRETDVMGRLGGDEFAVAGQFGSTGIEEAAMRLRQLATERNLKTNREFGLSFSIGWVTLDAGKREPLADLLARADEEMYKEKRRRKALRAVNAAVGQEPSFPIFSPRPGNNPEYENN
jgi:diguanylate cyclase (GGDEF)-like protein